MNALDLYMLTTSKEFEEDKDEYDEFIEALNNWVYKQDCNTHCRNIIKKMIKEKKQIIVYRGHNSSPFIRTNVPWFSTSKNKEIVKKEFSRENCCVFKIHIQIDVPTLDVYKYLRKGKLGDEDEIIVSGGGTFYDSEEMNKPGFKDIGNGEFETWYTFVNPVKIAEEITIERILDIIPKDEWDFIDSPDDIIMDIPYTLKETVFKHVKG